MKYASLSDRLWQYALVAIIIAVIGVFAALGHPDNPNGPRPSPGTSYNDGPTYPY